MVMNFTKMSAYKPLIRGKTKTFFSFICLHHGRIIWWCVFLIASSSIAISHYLWVNNAISQEVVSYGPTKQIKKIIETSPVGGIKYGKFQDFGLSIPKIESDLPVIGNVDGGNENEYVAALKKGVAHFSGTARPSDEKGNVFIFGHSSDWRKNNNEYGRVFSRLPELKEGDEISVWYQNKEYKYKIALIKIVDSKDLSWLNQTQNRALTLMTCYPVGSDKQRIVIRASFLQ